MGNNLTPSSELDTLIKLAEGSAIVRVLRRGVRAVERAVDGSRSRALVTAVIASVTPVLQEEKWQGWGITLITAAAVHVALLLARLPDANWRSLVIPGVIAAQGMLLIIAAWGRRR